MPFNPNDMPAPQDLGTPPPPEDPNAFNLADPRTWPQPPPGTARAPYDPPNINGSSSTDWQNYFRQRFGNLAPLPGYNTANQDQARLQQQQVVQDLQRQAAGDMNSRAQQSLYAQNNAAQGQQRSLASTQRGVGAGAQMQQAQTGAAQVRSGLAGQQQQLYLQEKQAAQQQLAQQLAAMQGQDITQANNAADVNLRGQAMRDAMQQWYAGQGAQGALDEYELQHGYQLADLGFNLEAANVTNQFMNRGANAAATGLSTLSQLDWGGGQAVTPAASRGSSTSGSSSQSVIDDAFNYDLGDYPETDSESGVA